MYYLSNSQETLYGATRYALKETDNSTSANQMFDTYGGEDPAMLQAALFVVNSSGAVTELFQRRSPSSDISSSGTWAVYPTTPTSRYDKVSDSTTTTGHDSDTTYLTHGTTSGFQIFGFNAFTIPSFSIIKSVKVYVTAKDASSGTNKIGGIVRVNGTDYQNGTLDEPGAAYATTSYEYTVNPNTNAPWTVADINGTSSNPLQGFGTYSNDANPQVRITQVYCEVVYSEGARSIVLQKLGGTQGYFQPVFTVPSDVAIPEGGGVAITIDAGGTEGVSEFTRTWYSPPKAGTESVKAGTHTLNIKYTHLGDFYLYWGNAQSWAPAEIYLGASAPNPPTNVAATLLYEDYTEKAVITWDMSATSYKLYGGTSPNPTTLIAEGITDTTYKYELPTEGTYYFRLKGTNDNGDSDNYSDSATLVADFGYPATVTPSRVFHMSSRVTDVYFSGPVDNDILSTSHFTVNGVEPTLAIRGWDILQKEIGMFQLGRWNKPRRYLAGEYTLPRTQGTIPPYLVYRCIQTGYGHATVEPTWPTTIGATVNDNQTVWRCEDMRQRVRLHHHRQAPNTTVTVNVSADLIGVADSESFTSEAPESKDFRILGVRSIDSQNTEVKFRTQLLAADLIPAKFSIGEATINTVTEQFPDYRVVIINHSNLSNGTHTLESTAKNAYRESLESGYDSMSFTVSTQHTPANGLTFDGCFNGLEMGILPNGTVRMAYIEDSNTSVTTNDLIVKRSADGTTYEQVNEAMFPANPPAYVGNAKYKPWDIVAVNGKSYRVYDIYGKNVTYHGLTPAGDTPTFNTGFRAITNLFSESSSYGEMYYSDQIYVYGVQFQENSVIKILEPIVENGKKIWIIEDLEPDYRRQPIKGGETAYYKVNNGTADSNAISEIFAADENWGWECGSNRYLHIQLQGGDYQYLPDLLSDTEREAFLLGWPKFGIGSVYANVCLQTIAGSFHLLQDDEFLWFLEKQLAHAKACQLGTTAPNRTIHPPLHTQGGYVGGWTNVNRTDYVGRASYSGLYASNILRKTPGNSWAQSLATELRATVGAWIKDYMTGAGTNTISYSGTIYGVAKSASKEIVNTTYGSSGNYFSPNQEFGFTVAAAYLYGEQGSELYQDAAVWSEIDGITQLTWALTRPYVGEMIKEFNSSSTITENSGLPSFLYAGYNNSLMEQVYFALTTNNITLPEHFTEVTDAIFKQMIADYPTVQRNTAYSYGDVVLAPFDVYSHTKHMYWLCTTAGTTGANEPNWASIRDHKATIMDGTVRWEAHYTQAYKPVSECHYSAAFEGYARNTGAAFPTLSVWMRGMRDDPKYTKTYRARVEGKGTGGSGAYGVGTTQSEWLAVFGSPTIYLEGVKNVDDVDLTFASYVPPGSTFSKVEIHRSTIEGFTPSAQTEIAEITNPATTTYKDVDPGDNIFYYKAVLTVTGGSETTGTSQEVMVIVGFPPQTIYADVKRIVHDGQSFYSDLLRMIVSGQSFNADTKRGISLEETVLSDTLRAISLQETASSDTKRVIVVIETEESDTLRKISEEQTVQSDTSRGILLQEIVYSDTNRTTLLLELSNSDTKRVISEIQQTNSDTNRPVVKIQTTESDTNRSIVRLQTESSDTKRLITLLEGVLSDTLRVVVTYDIQTITGDTKRIVIKESTINADTKRTVVEGQLVEADAKRIVHSLETILSDTNRVVTAIDIQEIEADTKRIVVRISTANADTKRTVVSLDEVESDVKRVIYNLMNYPGGEGAYELIFVDGDLAKHSSGKNYIEL